MSGIATAIGAAAVGGIAGSAIAAHGAESAANTQAQAAENAQQISQNEFNTITAQEQPFIQGGYGALNALEYGLGVGGSGGGSPARAGYDPSSGFTIGGSGEIGRLLPGGSGGAPNAASGYGSLIAPFTADMMKQYSPAYQFQLQQGQQGTLNAEAASNGALSGAAQKDLMSFNQNLANTSFNNAFNQYQTQQGNIYSRLAGIAQLGQAAATNTGQQGTALAGQAAQSATNIGTAQAAGTVGAANAISGGLSSLSSLPWLYNATSGGGGSGFGEIPAVSSASSDYAAANGYLGGP